MSRRATLFFTLGALALVAVIGGIVLLDDAIPGGGAQEPSDTGTLSGESSEEPPIRLPDLGQRAVGAAPPDVERPIEAIGLDQPATMVVGRVITRSGHPLPNALVLPYRLERDPPFSSRIEILKSARSDAVGRFDLPGLPVGTVLGIEVRHESHAPQLRESFSVQTTGIVDLGDIVLNDGMSLTGIVTNEEHVPVAGARIALSEVSGGLKRDAADTLVETQTDSDGRYELAHLALRQYGIDVSAEDYGRISTVLSLVLTTSSGSWEQDFRLERDDSLLGGVIIGPDESPIEDIGVRLTRRQPSGNSYYLRNLRTGADGRFLFERLPEGRYQLDLEAEDWYLQKPLEIAAGSDDTLVRALPALEVRGQLLVASGTAPRDFRVRNRPDGRTGAGLLDPSTLELEIRNSAPPGSFVVGGLRPGSYRFEIHASGFAATTSSDVIIGAAVGGANVVINLMRGGSLVGRVSPPAEGVIVELRGDEYDPSLAIEATFPTPPIHGLRTTTDKNGRFLFEHVPPESYSVSARPTSAPPAHAHGIAVYDEERTDIGALLLEAGGAIIGNVLGPDGRTRQGVRISASGLDHHQQTVTDAQGGFRLDALPPGDYEVRATPPGLWEALSFEARQSVTVRVGVDATILLTLAERGDQAR